MSLSTNSRVVAIDPTAKGFAYAVLEGSERLLDWSVPEVGNEQEFLARLRVLLDYAEPDALVFEDMRRSRRGERARAFIRAAKVLARKRGIAVVSVSRAGVRRHFSASENKHEVALTVARFFPELEPRLPRERKPWMSEDERMGIFDAVSFALSAFWRSAAAEKRETESD